MTHHVMTQMGHDIPNLLGIDPGLFDEHLAAAVPEYAAMGKDSTDPNAPDETLPKNSLPMVGGVGGFGYITMGGMVTLLKVRNGITDYADPGHYDHPSGTVASVATGEELARDGIDASETSAAPKSDGRSSEGAR